MKKTERELLKEIGIEKSKENINKNEWLQISLKPYLSEDFMRCFQDKLYWYNLPRNQKISEEFIEEFKESFNWKRISQYFELSSEFLNKYENYIHWKEYFQYQNVDFQIMKKFIFNTKWEDLRDCKTEYLTIEEIEYIEKLIKVKSLFSTK